MSNQIFLYKPNNFTLVIENGYFLKSILVDIFDKLGGTKDGWDIPLYKIRSIYDGPNFTSKKLRLQSLSNINPKDLDKFKGLGFISKIHTYDQTLYINLNSVGLLETELEYYLSSVLVNFKFLDPISYIDVSLTKSELGLKDIDNNKDLVIIINPNVKKFIFKPHDIVFSES